MTLVLLSVMMFLQYAVWGAWLPIASQYLSNGLEFTDGQVGMILGTAAAIGAVTAPFAGQIADRYFRAERVLALLLLVGGVIQITLATQREYGPFLGLSVVYAVVYMPTLGLTNSIAFAHLRDPEKQFPLMRLWGTIGWIAAGWAWPLIWLPLMTTAETRESTMALGESLRFSGVLSLGYAVLCLALPATPPKQDATEKFAVARALGLLRHRSFLVLVCATLVIATIHSIYFMRASPYLSHLGVEDADISKAMSIGQFSEIALMFAVAFFLKQIGFRRILVIGGLAYFLRYAIWSLDGVLPVPVLVGSQALHGVCFACFFAASFIYVDRIAPADVRHSAQTLFTILVFGAGPVLAAELSTWMGAAYTDAQGVLDYGSLWLTVSAIGLAVAVFLGVAFRDQTKSAEA